MHTPDIRSSWYGRVGDPHPHSFALSALCGLRASAQGTSTSTSTMPALLSPLFTHFYLFQTLQVVNLLFPFLFLRTRRRRVMQCSEFVQAASLVLLRR